MNPIRCTECNKDVEPIVETVQETLPVRGADVVVDARVAHCPDCGEALYCEDLDSATLKAAFDVYRRRHNMMTADEITRLRQTYGLSQKSLSLLLGWGEVTLHRYETGSLQDTTHDTALRLLVRPENMRLLVERNGSLVPQTQVAALEARIDELLHDGTSPEGVGLAAIGRRAMLDQYSGFRRYDPAKLTEMMIFFCRLPDMTKTKLNKLLFYSDFSFFKKFTVSISGAPYLHMQYGPVPEHYDLIQAAMVEEGLIEEIEVPMGQYMGMVIKPRRDPDLGVLSGDEQSALEFIAAQLGSWTAKTLSEKSHSEEAWATTSYLDRIPYLLAESLSVTLP